jgi:hypothetical protein
MLAAALRSVFTQQNTASLYDPLPAAGVSGQVRCKECSLIVLDPVNDGEGQKQRAEINSQC